MSFGIDITIPAAGNDPADDQQPMQQNFANIRGFLNVDHVTPGTIGDGFHTKITFFTENVPAILPTDPVSIDFTANAQVVSGVLTAGMAVSSASPKAQDFFANQNGVFPLSAIRAFALVTAPTTVSNGFNVGTITNPNPGKFTVALAANCVSNALFSIQLSSSLSTSGTPRQMIGNYTIISAGVFDVQFQDDLDNFVNPTNFSITVLQI